MILHLSAVTQVSMIRRLSVLFFAVLLSACSSESWKITLKDGRVLSALAEPEFQRKTGYYRYENEGGKDALVKAQEVLLIERQR